MYGILDDLETRTGVLKVKEIADILRVSEDAIYDLADQGTIPSFTVGKQRRFDPKTVAYWIRKKDPTFAQAAFSFALSPTYGYHDGYHEPKYKSMR
jgi:excisionase family DNA binding protein